MKKNILKTGLILAGLAGYNAYAGAPAGSPSTAANTGATAAAQPGSLSVAAPAGNGIHFGALKSRIYGNSREVKQTNTEGHRLTQPYGLCDGDTLTFNDLETRADKGATPDSSLVGLPVRFYVEGSEGKRVYFGSDNSITSDELESNQLYGVVAYAKGNKLEESVVGHLATFGDCADSNSQTPTSPAEEPRDSLEAYIINEESKAGTVGYIRRNTSTDVNVNSNGGALVVYGNGNSVGYNDGSHEAVYFIEGNENEVYSNVDSEEDGLVIIGEDNRIVPRD